MFTFYVSEEDIVVIFLTKSASVVEICGLYCIGGHSILVGKCRNFWCHWCVISYLKRHKKP